MLVLVWIAVQFVRSMSGGTVRMIWYVSVTLPRFSPGYEGTENMFYFFYKTIIFLLNKEKGACVWFNLFSWNSKFVQLGDRTNHIAHVIFVLHSAMKAHLLTNQTARVLSKLVYITVFYVRYCEDQFITLLLTSFPFKLTMRFAIQFNLKYKNGSNEAVSTEVFLKALSFRRLRRRQR